MYQVSQVTYRRFRALRSSLHKKDNSQGISRGEDEYDRFHKVRLLIEIVKQNCLNAYYPHQQLSIDEAMVAFKGRSSLKQYIPLKATKRGFKVWSLCDSTNGYISNFDVYSGASSHGYPSDLGLGAQVILKLANPFINRDDHLILIISFIALNCCQH